MSELGGQITNNSIATEQYAVFEGLVLGVKVQYYAGGDQYFRFTNWTESTLSIDEGASGIQTYNRFPFTLGAIKNESSTTLPTVTLTLPITTEIYNMIRQNTNNIVGRPVVVYMTTPDILDADSSKYIKYEYVTNSVAFNDQAVQLSLGVRLNLNGVTVPRRQFRKMFCPWIYKDRINCPYFAAKFDTDGTPIAADTEMAAYTSAGSDVYWNTVGTTVASADLDYCGKTLRDCMLRQLATKGAYSYGASEHRTWFSLPFGGFPAVPNKDPKKIG